MVSSMATKKKPIPRKKLGKKAPRTIQGWKHPKLTEQMIEQVADFMTKGVPINTICDFLGVLSGTFYAWVKQGELYLASGGTPAEAQMQGQLVQRMRQADALYKMGLIERVNQDGRKDWVRIMTLLERRERRSFGRQETQGHGTQGDAEPDERYL